MAYNLFCRSNADCFVRPRRQLYCETCRIAHNLWICMVCGHIGCGRYTEEHANRHFSLSRHTYRYAAQRSQLEERQPPWRGVQISLWSTGY